MKKTEESRFKATFRIGLIIILANIIIHFIPWLLYGSFANQKALDFDNSITLISDYIGMVYFVMLLIFSLTDNKKNQVKNVGLSILFIIAIGFSSLPAALIFDLTKLIGK